MKYSTGALIDTRADKSKDFLFEEIVAFADPVIWQEKTESDWRKYPIYNQGQSNQCVAFSLAKMMAIQHLKDEGEWVDFSATHLYERRSNYPSAGMAGINAFDLARTQGVTLEPLYPNKVTNNDLDRLTLKKHYAQVGEIFKINSYLSLPTNDIDTVASVIQRTGKGVMVWYWGTYNEWDREVVEIKDPNTLLTAPVRHSVVATDYILHKGKKALIIEDSWGNRGIKGRRIVTEEFHKARNYYVGHMMNFVFEPVKSVDFDITSTLTFGQRNNQVIELQKMLQYEGLFPANITPTNYYGSITARAVLEWQLKHKVASVPELNALQGRSFGPASLKKFKELY